MRTKLKKFTSVCLAVIMILSVLTVAPLTADAAENNSESVGDTYTSGVFEYRVLDDGTAEITGYNGSATELEIPSTLDGYTVTSIGSWSITRKSIFGVTIPDSVTNIEGDAFYGCSNLKKIVVPDSVTMIGDDAFSDTAWYENKSDGVVYAGKVVYKYKGEMEENTPLLINYGTKGIAAHAFEGCYHLASITFPETLETIGSYAFSGTAISYVLIPSKVTYIADTAFEQIGTLEQIVVDIANSAYSSSNGVLFNKDKTKIIRYPNGKTFPYYNIPNGVTEIGRAFSYCDNLESVYLPDGVTTICESAFEDSGITSITLPDGVRNIGRYAFNYCIFLKTITIPDSVTNIEPGAFNDTEWYDNKPDKSVVYAGKIAYEYKGEMPANTSIVIKDGTTIIQEYAFIGCGGLVSIDIPYSVTEIGRGAFEGCDNLKSIAIPDGVTEIKDNTFRDCKSLENVKIGSGVIAIGEYVFQNCISLRNVNIPEGIEMIDAYAFEFCNSLEKIVFPESLEVIGYRAFFSCDNLTSVTMPCSTYVSDSAFLICEKLSNVIITGSGEWADTHLYVYTGLMTYCENVVLQYGVTEIGIGAFSGYNIKNVSIPDSVTKIGDAAFSDCTELQSITMPNSITEIGNQAFSGCTGLQNVNISDNCNSIGQFAFLNCTELSKITIPSNANYIGYYAFGYYFENQSYYDYKKIDGFTIYGYTGTSAETYANENGFTFIALDSQQIGDVNGDGKISIDDVTDIQKYIANTMNFTEKQMALADVDKDGKVAIDDVTLIQKHLAGMAVIE